MSYMFQNHWYFFQNEKKHYDVLNVSLFCDIKNIPINSLQIYFWHLLSLRLISAWNWIESGANRVSSSTYMRWLYCRPQLNHSAAPNNSPLKYLLLSYESGLCLRPVCGQPVKEPLRHPLLCQNAWHHSHCLLFPVHNHKRMRVAGEASPKEHTLYSWTLYSWLRFVGKEQQGY